MTPRKRDDDLVVEQTDTEVLVYDLRTDDAHHLDADAAAVWKASDGARSVAEIASVTGLGDEAVAFTLVRLIELELVIDDEERHTRRETLHRSLIGAGVLVALPVIKSIAAPEAAQAASLGGSGASCSTGADCVRGTCVNGACV